MTSQAYVIDNKFHLGPTSQFKLQLEDNCWWCMGAELAGTPLVPSLAADALVAGSDGGDHCNPGVFPVANEYATCATPAPIRKLQRLPNPDPTRPDPVVAIDPRPAAGSGLLGTDRPAPADGFFMPAAYKGAFHSNWAAGYWTALSRLGYFPLCDTAMNPQAIPDEVQNLRFTSKTLMSWEAQPFNTRGYDVLTKPGTTSAAAASFTTIDTTCLETMDFDEQATLAATPAPSQVFFVLVRAVNDCGNGTLGLRSNGTERAGIDCP
jgi:hypothetical protein